MKLKYKFAIEKVASFWAAVPILDDAEKYHAVLSLNEISARVLKLLEHDTTEEEIIQTILQEYEAEESVVRADVADLLKKMREADILLEDKA